MITRRKLFQGALTVPVVALAAPRIVSAAPSVTWRMQSQFISTSVPYREAERFAQKVSKATNGKFKIDVFASGQLVSEAGLLDAIGNGPIECGQVPLGRYEGTESALIFASGVPFGPDAEGHAKWWAKGGGRRIINAILKPRNINALACGDFGVRTGGWYKDPLSSLDDLAGLKIRLNNPGGIASGIFVRLGANPVLLPASEIYPALQTGIIDAADSLNLTEDEKLRFYEVAPVCYRKNWWQPGAMIHLIVNRDAWSALPNAYRKALAQACDNAHVHMLTKYQQTDKAAARRIKAAGAKLKGNYPKSVLRQARKAAKAEMKERAAENSAFTRVWRSYKKFELQEMLV